jgi:hypothetical protein
MERAPQRSWSDILGTIGIVGLLLTSPAAAQQPPPPASASAQNPPKVYEKSNGDQNSKSQEQEARPKNDRIFWTLPKLSNRGKCRARFAAYDRRKIRTDG